MGDPARTSTIKGRVIGAQPGQQIVLYARAMNDYGQLIWFVQPLVLDPFTKIQSGSKWRNTTHPGAEYAALLVEPEFQPPWKTPVLPTQGVVAVAITQGWPPFWTSWWFPLLCAVALAVLISGFYRMWHYNLTNKLNLRFEERLAERMRIAQELHDTLLQGVLSASMQLHVAVDSLPGDSPARPRLVRTLELMTHVVEEGRNTLRGLRSSVESDRDLQRSFSQVPQEVGNHGDIDFRVIVQGESLPLRAAIHDEIYRIGREALVNAFRHSHASSIEVLLEFEVEKVRLLVTDDGCGIDSQVLQFGRDGHWGLSGMRSRADRIGANLRVLSRPGAGTEVELSVPKHVACVSQPRQGISKWISSFLPRWKSVNHESPSEEHR